MEHLEEAIRERAYQLWVADGRPEGKSDAYWLNAQHEMLMHSIDLAVAEDPVPVPEKPRKRATIALLKKQRRSAA
jgi:Protein of unknown function (DUF2934)